MAIIDYEKLIIHMTWKIGTFEKRALHHSWKLSIAGFQWSKKLLNLLLNVLQSIERSCTYVYILLFKIVCS